MKWFRMLTTAVTLQGLMFTVSLRGQWVQVVGSYGGSTTSVIANGNDLIAGTFDGLYRSSNAGLTWSPWNSDLSSSVVALAGNGETFLAATNTGIYRLSNGGESWTRVSDTSASSLALRKNAVGDLMVFAARGTTGVYCSTDTGATWAQVLRGGNCVHPSAHVQECPYWRCDSG
jgi:photosystem II stability/assembly factor-like uncharacterized protein